MDPWIVGVVAAVVLQVLQTIQIAVVGKKVSRTLAPPPPPQPVPVAAPCRECGSLTLASSLHHGVCGHCVATEPSRRSR